MGCLRALIGRAGAEHATIFSMMLGQLGIILRQLPLRRHHVLPALRFQWVVVALREGGRGDTVFSVRLRS